MKQIQLRSYGKINLCLDVLRRLENGYHEVEMIMQQILLCDDISVKWMDEPRSALSRQSRAETEQEDGITIEVSANKPWLPRDQRNLAYQAAQRMAELYGSGKRGKVRIDIKKRIPVAAGLAGGSGNGAAVLHALNALWELGLDVAELCRIGKSLGSDIPFSIMGQAKVNTELGLSRDPLAAHCAVARGTGTDLQPLKRGLRSHLLLTKPPIGVSTAEVYRGLDLEAIGKRPDVPRMIKALEEGNYKIMKKNMINVLETFTLTRYPSVMYTKNKVENLLGRGSALMSGSGPTIFALCRTRRDAQSACEELKRDNKETFWTRTTY